MDTAPLRMAYEVLLEVAATVDRVDEERRMPPAGEWTADQILAHIACVDAGTIAAASTVASGSVPIYDNRTWLDTWTLERVRASIGCNEQLRKRIRVQGQSLCRLGQELSEIELDTLVPTLLLSGDSVVVDQLMPLRALISGLASDHLP